MTDQELAALIAGQEGLKTHRVEGDRGGQTSAGGISARYYAKRQGMALEDAERACAAMTLEEAKRIIIDDFIAPFEGIHPIVRPALASCAMNMGQGAAVRALQAACNELGVSPRLAVDGALGPRTRQAVKSVSPRGLAKAFCGEWNFRYHQIVKANPDQAKFLKGWMNRIVFWLNRIPPPMKRASKYRQEADDKFTGA